MRRSSVHSKLGNPFNMHRDETDRDNTEGRDDTEGRDARDDTEGRDDDAKTEIWAAEQTKLEGRLRPDPTNRRPNTKPGERWNELARLADLLRKGAFDVRLGCVCRPSRCHAESIIRQVTALAQKRSTEAASGAGPSSEGASAEGGSDGAASRGASDDPPNEQLEGSADDSEACE